MKCYELLDPDLGTYTAIRLKTPYIDSVGGWTIDEIFFNSVNYRLQKNLKTHNIATIIREGVKIDESVFQLYWHGVKNIALTESKGLSDCFSLFDGTLKTGKQMGELTRIVVTISGLYNTTGVDAWFDSYLLQKGTCTEEDILRNIQQF